LEEFRRILLILGLKIAPFPIRTEIVRPQRDRRRQDQERRDHKEFNPTDRLNFFRRQLSLPGRILRRQIPTAVHRRVVAATIHRGAGGMIIVVVIIIELTAQRHTITGRYGFDIHFFDRIHHEFFLVWFLKKGKKNKQRLFMCLFVCCVCFEVFFV